MNRDVNLQTDRNPSIERSYLPIDRLPLAYIQLDSSFRVVDWNPAAENIFGYSKAEVLGCVCFDLLVHLPMDNSVQDVIRRIEAGDIQADSVSKNRTKDGRTITCRWFNTPLLTPTGKFEGLVSLAQDITQRQLTEEMLDRTRRRYEAIFEHSLDPILLFDNSTRFVDCNPAACAMLGYERDELLELTALDVMPFEDREYNAERIVRFLARGTASGESKLLTKPDETRDIEFRAVANILPGIHKVFVRDITNRKRDEEAMQGYVERLRILSRRVIEVQEEERRHLARELHDEFGQLLSAIGINLQAVKDVSDASARLQLDETSRIVNRAIDQIRDISLNLRPSMLDDLGLVSTLRWYADRRAQSAGIKLHFTTESTASSIPPDLAIVCYRVAQEAITNVVRHAHARDIWLDVRGDDTMLEVWIRDNGEGFNLEVLKDRRSRLGVLGMNERVELLGGQFHIESQPGAGTSVRVTFFTKSLPAE
jgi:PAS domain S-box-containing protein